MTSAEIPRNEAERIQAVIQLGLLDTLPEERFDRLTRLVQRVFGVQAALITLVDADRQWFKSRQGLNIEETPREISFCSHAILTEEILEVSDARHDPRFHDNPAVVGAPHIRFYAGAPLFTPEGHAVGTLCLIDAQPRQLTQDEREQLKDFAACVQEQVNSHRALVRDVTYERKLKKALKCQTRITEIIALAQQHFIQTPDQHKAFEAILQSIVELTQSTYGFIGKVHNDSYGAPYLKTYAAIDVSGHNKRLSPPDNLTLTHLSNLFGRALTTGQPVISNDPKRDLRLGTLPKGHPPLESCLAIPIYCDGKVVALLALANRPEGYGQTFIDFLQPLLVTIGQLEIAAQTRHAIIENQNKIERLSRVARDTTNGVVITDPRGRVEWANEGFTRLTGYNQEEVQGRKPGDFLQGEATDPETVKVMHEALAAHQPFEVEILNYTKTGTPYWAHISCNTLRDSSETLQGFIAIESDITQKRQDAERIKASEARLNALIEAASIGTWEWHLQNGELLINARWADMLGYTLMELEPQLFKNWLNLTHPEDKKNTMGLLNQHIAGQLDYYDSVFRMRHKDGQWVWIHGRGQVTAWDAKGHPSVMIGTHVDITEERSAGAVAQELLQRLKKLTSHLPGMVYQYQRWPDGSACFPYVSAGITHLLGIAPEALEENADLLLQAVHQDDFEQFIEGNHQSETHLTPFSAQFRVINASGESLWTECYASPERLDDGSTLWHGYLVDIHMRKMAEAALEEEARHTQTIINNMVNGIITIDTAGIIQSFNPAAERLFGYSSEEMIGQNVNRLMPPPYRDSHDSYLHNYQTTGLARVIGIGREVEGICKDGRQFHLELSVSEIKHGDQTMYLGMARDISQRKASEEEINRLAFYDPLTRLPNRRLFSDRLKQGLAASGRRRTHGALLFIDLDNFKNLNDTAGHDTGDRLLQQVAERLSGCVREGDTVARLGGDEFVVILEGLSDVKETAASQAELVGEKIRVRLNEPYTLKGRDYQGSPSIGITLFFSHRQTAEELLKQADMAMYEAKAAGRNALYFFDPDMQSAIESRIAMENELRTAIREEQLTLYYQIQVDATGNAIGAEALLRWEHPTKGMIPPNEFIPLAEETRLILPIGQWVLRTACRQLAIWATRPETHHLTLSVNISALQFAQADFVADVLTSLELAKANPARLKLELTESLLASNVESVIVKMRTLKAQGVGFSLDDFGTGYSSLAYLKRLPIEQLKIDQSFVRDLLDDPSDAIIAQTIIALADSMALGVIAEGVETEEHRQALADMGCFAYQGYLFGRPQQLDVFEAVIHDHASVGTALKRPH